MKTPASDKGVSEFDGVDGCWGDGAVTWGQSLELPDAHAQSEREGIRVILTPD